MIVMMTTYDKRAQVYFRPAHAAACVMTSMHWLSSSKTMARYVRACGSSIRLSFAKNLFDNRTAALERALQRRCAGGRRRRTAGGEGILLSGP